MDIPSRRFPLGHSEAVNSLPMPSPSGKIGVKLRGFGADPYSDKRGWNQIPSQPPFQWQRIFVSFASANLELF
jgi:hypothetical protein